MFMLDFEGSVLGDDLDGMHHDIFENVDVGKNKSPLR